MYLFEYICIYICEYIDVLYTSIYSMYNRHLLKCCIAMTMINYTNT